MPCCVLRLQVRVFVGGISQMQQTVCTTTSAVIVCRLGTFAGLVTFFSAVEIKLLPSSINSKRICPVFSLINCLMENLYEASILALEGDLPRLCSMNDTTHPSRASVPNIIFCISVHCLYRVNPI